MNMNNQLKRMCFTGALPGLVLACGAILVPTLSQAEPAASAVGRAALTVRTVTLREDKWARTLAANGSIIPWQEAIISAQLQGLRIAEVKVSIGDHVQQGDLLVTLGNVARVGNDSSAPFAMPYSIQGRIVAPDSGIISSAHATVDSLSQPGMELFRLIRKGRLEWRAELTAEELMLIRRGMNEVDARGQIIRFELECAQKQFLRLFHLPVFHAQMPQSQQRVITFRV